ncbi:cytochrome P450 93A2-like [Tripterygium wilfordii]|uniref:cytochrome P450 93A2-like n=1 Tax=Tripterygium wilfordii TaxID=458696 RepID=UPI0018F80BA9|nr:cytochrome P450 93A2-like [Tripterygium wilfordii]
MCIANAVYKLRFHSHSMSQVDDDMLSVLPCSTICICLDLYMDLFFAATNTSSSTMQWALGELINNPEVFKKLRDEINAVVGSNRLDSKVHMSLLKIKVEYSTILENCSYTYLQAVIRETLRLHTSAPLILRECTEDCRVNGFLVKAKTRVLINVFALTRDPKFYTNPDEFMPKQFLESSDEKIGDHRMEIQGSEFSISGVWEWTKRISRCITSDASHACCVWILG